MGKPEPHACKMQQYPRMAYAPGGRVTLAPRHHWRPIFSDSLRGEMGVEGGGGGLEQMADECLPDQRHL